MQSRLAVLLGCLIMIMGTSACCCQQKGSCQVSTTQPASAIYNYTVPEFAKLLENSDVQLVDVRTPQEYASGHIDKAMLIDVKADNFITQAEKMLDPKKPVAVYCRSGGRSAKAADLLLKKGFTVYNLKGGYTAYEAEQQKTSK